MLADSTTVKGRFTAGYATGVAAANGHGGRDLILTAL
jgi:hypothetical protein